LIRTAIAAVWLYEGFWCKLLGRDPRQGQVVEAVPYFGPRAAVFFLKALGAAEIGLAVWALSGIAPRLCAATQTVLLVTLNVNGLIWARHIIHDPGGMVVKNIAFLVLVWVAASLPPWM
jgi:uncharacterized membrane protein YphA (DoxX/SURF4 family)